METVHIILYTIGAIVTVGGVVAGFIYKINKAREDSIKESKEKLEETEKYINEDIKDLENKFTDFVKSTYLSAEYVNKRLLDLDLWRKEINGQIKLVGSELQHTNKLIEVQSEQLKTLTTSNNSLVTSIAVIAEVINKKINLGESSHV